MHERQSRRKMENRFPVRELFNRFFPCKLVIVHGSLEITSCLEVHGQFDRNVLFMRAVCNFKAFTNPLMEALSLGRGNAFAPRFTRKGMEKCIACGLFAIRPFTVACRAQKLPPSSLTTRSVLRQ